jgi:hypothetical protein
LAISRPIMITSDTDASSSGAQHLHFGTSMPSGGVHPIIKASANDPGPEISTVGHPTKENRGMRTDLLT